MKIFLILLLGFFTMNYPYQGKANAVFSNLEAKGINGIKKDLSTTVVLTIENVQTVYSQRQAISVLESYFKRNSIKSFEPLQKGLSSDETNFYIIGNLIDVRKNIHKIYLFLRLDDNNYEIKEIRIE